MRHAIVLAGGGGTRLWPESRKSKPKQFLSLLSDDGQSMLQSTLTRMGGVVSPQHIHVVTTAAQKEWLEKDCPSLPRHQLIFEPQARNTAPAIGLAAVHLISKDPDATLAVVPSDQFVASTKEFARIASIAFEAAEKNEAIVTVGIVPSFPATGYGYLETGEAQTHKELFEVKRFVEKPDLKQAERYIESGNYLWNGGMFFAKAKTILTQIETHMPSTHALLQEIRHGLEKLSPDKAEALQNELYGKCEAISFDYGVMEKADSVLTVKGDFGWNDVGSWNAIHDISPKDSENNVSLGNSVLVDSKNNLIKTNKTTLVACLGVENLIVVQSGDSILITTKEHSENIKTLVSTIRESTHKDAL